MARSKSLVGWIAAVSAVAALCSWLSFIPVTLLENRELTHHFKAVVEPFQALARKLQTEGLPPDLPEQLARLPKDKSVSGYALVDATSRQVIAGDTADVVGKSINEVGASHTLFGPAYSYQAQDVHASDSRSYWLVAFNSGLAIGYNRLAHVAFGSAGAAFTAAAWLSLALWLFTDARQRSPVHAPAWGFLGLATGPIALAVYRVVRPAAEVCPGCGETLEPGGPFCPGCGYALRPTCPDCHQPVQHAWRHCRACGASFQDET